MGISSERAKEIIRQKAEAEGITVSEFMARKGQKGGGHPKSGFASMNTEKVKEISHKGVEARLASKKQEGQK